MLRSHIFPKFHATSKNEVHIDMMRTTSLMVFAASIAIIFAFFYQVDTVEAGFKGKVEAKKIFNKDV